MEPRDTPAPTRSEPVSATGVRIHEVGLRDGLQNEVEIVQPGAKLRLLDRLAAAGLRSIEVTSFVSPRWVPQLADADVVAQRFERRPGVSYSAWVPNLAGYERFTGTGIDVAAFFVSASETHNQKNVNQSIAGHLARFREVADRITSDHVRLRCEVSMVCGCPYEGRVDPGAVAALVARVLDLDADEISLGDTVGVGSPRQVRDLVRSVGRVVSLDRVSLHLHDTYGRALVNAVAGYEEGIRQFDTALGGLGSCPYAPGAAGNVATEDVVDLFEREGVATGIDLDSLVETTAWVERDLVKRALPGRVYRARAGVAGPR